MHSFMIIYEWECLQEPGPVPRLGCKKAQINRTCLRWELQPGSGVRVRLLPQTSPPFLPPKNKHLLSSYYNASMMLGAGNKCMKKIHSTYKSGSQVMHVPGPRSNCVCGRGTSLHQQAILRHQQHVQELNPILTLSHIKFPQNTLPPHRPSPHTSDTSHKPSYHLALINQL